MKTSIANLIWLQSLSNDYKSFKKYLKDPHKIQNRILKKYLQENKNTVYGKKYSFTSINSISEFQRRLPIISYEDIEGYIKKIAQGKKDILSTYQTLFFEETSGSGTESKIIPYNKLFKKEFNLAISPWVWEIHNQYPKVFMGKSYWSISPPLKSNWRTECGIKVGIDDDSEYLNFFGRFLLNQIILKTINNDKICSDAEDFYINTLRSMITAKNLSFISVWSPSFILQMNQILRKNWNSIVSKSLNIDVSSPWSVIFPSLKLISCWMHASSSQYKEELEYILGDILIQPKGLLSTEGIVSIPFKKDKDPVISICSHFYEFECQKTGDILLSHQLVKGGKYEAILSTGNGFMRYRTNDIIIVTGYIESTPTIIFLGRKNRTSDIVGEKVNEIICNEIINSIRLKLKISGAFFYPSKNRKKKYYYTLVISTKDNCLEKDKIQKLAENILKKNPYYSQAISLNQLDKLIVQIVDDDNYKRMMRNYFSKKKIKSGDQKPPILLLIEDIKYMRL